MFQPICPLVFFRCFMSNLGAHTESWTEPFIWTTGVDCSNSYNHDQVQILNYSKYSLLFLPVVEIESATSWWFYSKALSNKMSYPLHSESLPDIFIFEKSIYSYFFLVFEYLKLIILLWNWTIKKMTQWKIYCVRNL